MKSVETADSRRVILTDQIYFFKIAEYFNFTDLYLMSFKLNKVTRNINPIKVMKYMIMKKPVRSNRLPYIFYE